MDYMDYIDQYELDCYLGYQLARAAVRWMTSSNFNTVGDIYADYILHHIANKKLIASDAYVMGIIDRRPHLWDDTGYSNVLTHYYKVIDALC